MLITVNKLNNLLSGVIGNEKYCVEYNAETHQELLILESTFDKATTIAEVKLLIEQAKHVITNIAVEDSFKGVGEYLKHNLKTDEYFLYSNDVISSIPLPKVLVEKIIEAKEKDIDFLPMIKAWMWFLKNPNFSLQKAKKFAKYITTTYIDSELRDSLVLEGYSLDKANEMATFNDVAITKNGLIQTYKYVTIKYKMKDTKTGEDIDRYSVSYDQETGEAKVELPENAEDYYLVPPIMRENGDSFYAGADLGHRVVVGAVHSLAEWSQVDCNDSKSCVKGLHLGGRQYIQGYGGRTELLLHCFVNPMNIGAFTDDGSGAMRVKSFFVHSAAFAENKSFYNESIYLEHSNSEWTQIRQEAINDSEDKISKIKKLQKEINAL